MAKSTSKDYIPSFVDIEDKRIEAETRAKEARDRGYHLGEYEVSYDVAGMSYTEKIAAVSKAEAIEQLKHSCGMVGWCPTNIDVRVLVEPNVYV